MSAVEPVVVRAGRPDETDGVIDLVLRAFGTMRPLLTPTCWSALTANVRSGLCGSDGTFNQTAWSGPVLVGAVAYSGPQAPRHGFRPGWSYIRALGVEPAYGGRGIGRLLVQSCIEQALTDQASAIALYTADANEQALRLYEKLGFAACPQPMTKYGLAYHQHVLTL